MTTSRSSSLKDLQTIPGVGPKIAANLWKIGIRSVADLRGRDPEAIYRTLGEREGGSVDGGRGPGLCPGVHFRRTRPWIKATGEWRAEGSSLDRCALYVLRCAVYYASHKKHDPEKLKWWRWKDKV